MVWCRRRAGQGQSATGRKRQAAAISALARSRRGLKRWVVELWEHRERRPLMRRLGYQISVNEELRSILCDAAGFGRVATELWSRFR